MSKTIPSGLLTHYALGTQTVARCLLLTRADGTVRGYTNASQPLRIDGVLYRAMALVDLSDTVSSNDLAVNNAELRITPDDALTILRTDLMTGLWDHAAWQLFEINYLAVTQGAHVIAAGHLGEHRLNRGEFVFELRGIAQMLQNPVGASTSKTCRYRLGSTALPAGLCKLALGPFTVTGTLTSAASRQTFTDTARAEPDDYFGEGLLTWTGGANAGYSGKIKTYAADTFTLVRPAYFAVAAGDTYSAIAGCRKRLAEDCITKFSNELNFGGEPHLPGMDEMLRAPVTSV